MYLKHEIFKYIFIHNPAMTQYEELTLSVETKLTINLPSFPVSIENYPHHEMCVTVAVVWPYF